MKLLRRTRRVRVPLFTYNHTLTPIYDTDPDPGDTPDPGTNPDPETIPDLSGILESISFSMYPSIGGVHLLPLFPSRHANELCHSRR